MKSLEEEEEGRLRLSDGGVRIYMMMDILHISVAGRSAKMHDDVDMLSSWRRTNVVVYLMDGSW